MRAAQSSDEPDTIDVSNEERSREARNGARARTASTARSLSARAPTNTVTPMLRDTDDGFRPARSHAASRSRHSDQNTSAGTSHAQFHPAPNRPAAAITFSLTPPTTSGTDDNSNASTFQSSSARRERYERSGTP